MATSNIIGGVCGILCALFWLILGIYVFRISTKGGCFSKWWPRTYGIWWIIFGLCTLSGGIAMFFGKSTPVKVDATPEQK